MTKYKLTYFDLSGLGEAIRYLLAYSKADFEDYRVSHEEWAKIKDRTPSGKLPLLEFDDVQSNQSSAIARYLAKQCGLAGDNDKEQLKIDATVDDIIDLRICYLIYFREGNEVEKKKKMEEIKTVHNPLYLSQFEKAAKENNGFLALKKLSWADVLFAAHCIMFEQTLNDPNWLDNYPNLLSLKKKVEDLPGIKEYRNKS